MGIGKRLKKLRESLGHSQKEFSDLMGVSLQVYQRYEYEKQVPGADKVARLLDNLKDVNPTWLLTGEGPMFLNEIPQIPGIEDDEREILRILREYPQLKPKILKLLKGIKTVDEAMEEIKTQTSMNLETTPQK